ARDVEDRVGRDWDVLLEIRVAVSPGERASVPEHAHGNPGRAPLGVLGEDGIERRRARRLVGSPGLRCYCRGECGEQDGNGAEAGNVSDRAAPHRPGLQRSPLHPGPRTTRPGVAPVCSPSASTCTPLTNTYSTPVA